MAADGTKIYKNVSYIYIYILYILYILYIYIYDVPETESSVRPDAVVRYMIMCNHVQSCATMCIDSLHVAI